MRCINLVKRFNEATALDKAMDNISKNPMHLTVKDLKSMSDDEVKKACPMRYEQVLKRLKGKLDPISKSNGKSEPSAIEDRLLALVMGAKMASKKEIKDGVFNFKNKESKFALDLTVDTNKKLITVKNIQTDDKLFLDHSAKKLKYKIKGN